jgi:hypothetical protein
MTLSQVGMHGPTCGPQFFGFTLEQLANEERHRLDLPQKIIFHLMFANGSLSEINNKFSNVNLRIEQKQDSKWKFCQDKKVKIPHGFGLTSRVLANSHQLESWRPSASKMRRPNLQAPMDWNPRIVSAERVQLV